MITTSKTHTVVGVFDDYATAQRVITRLEEIGVHRDDIDLTSSGATDRRTATSNREEEGGGISGMFRRIFGMDDDDRYTGDYSEAIRRGRTVVTVATDEANNERVADVMNEFGAHDIDQDVETWRKEGYSPAYANAEEFRDTEYLEQGKDLGVRPGASPAYDPTPGYDPSVHTLDRKNDERIKTSSTGGNAGNIRQGTLEAHNIPVVQEELRVGKRAVNKGGVRIYTRVHKQPVEEQVRLREERVRVDRRPADRPATPADIRDHDDVVEVAEMAEEAVVDKRTRVVEEIVVGKDVTERTETIRDTVRRSDVNVERLGGEAESFGNYEADFRNHFKSRYGTDRSARWEDYSPAYQYGYQSASDTRYRGRNWNDVEPDLRRDYQARYPNSAWERMKESIRYGWEKMTGQHSHHSHYDDDFRNDFTTRYGSDRSARWEDYSPAYQYGYQMASNERYRGRNWSEVESDLRRDYETRYPNSTWERMKDSIRYGWDKMTGRR